MISGRSGYVMGLFRLSVSIGSLSITNTPSIFCFPFLLTIENGSRVIVFFLLDCSFVGDDDDDDREALGKPNTFRFLAGVSSS